MDLQVIGSLIWVAVDGLGLIAALVALFAWPRVRPVAALVATAMLLSLAIHGAWPLVLRYAEDAVAQGDWIEEDRRSLLVTWSFAAGVVGAVAKTLLVVAAFAWRAPSASDHARPTTVAPVPGEALPPLSKAARIGGILATIVVSLACSGLALLLAQQRHQEVPVLALLAVVLVTLIVATILVMTTLHALWRTIQPPPRGRGGEGLARTTPASAIGLMFVPLFNFYWSFQAIAGLATDLNRTLDAAGIEGARVPRGLGITWCVLGIVGCIPIVGVVVGLAGLVIVPLFLAAAIDAANRLRSAPAD